jgi:drug/metabolite transporter (DMT)-like permease
VFLNLVPVFAAVLAVGLIGEPFAGYHGLALFLVLGGIWLAQRTPGSREGVSSKYPPNSSSP